jgi:hypothetical protein
MKYVTLASIQTWHLHRVQYLCTNEILYSPLTGNPYYWVEVQKWIVLMFLKSKEKAV